MSALPPSPFDAWSLGRAQGLKDAAEAIASHLLGLRAKRRVADVESLIEYLQGLADIYDPPGEGGDACTDKPGGWKDA